MAKEVVELLAPHVGGVYVDGTLGAGGHARAVLASIAGQGLLIGIDRDEAALKLASAALAPWQESCRLVRGNFSGIKSVAQNLGLSRVAGIVFDLGLSAMQLDQAPRGFSFMKNGPLDMRMDSSLPKTAADLIEGLSAAELERLIKEYGEESAARKIAAAIARARGQKEIWTTRRLAGIIAAAVGRRRGRIHPATRTFQALRMAVNNELDELARALEDGLSLLETGGRMVVIAYHSLEDRQVKTIFKKHIGRWLSKAEGGQCWTGAAPLVRLVVKKPLRPARAEILANPRARSAKMRCIERMD